MRKEAKNGTKAAYIELAFMTEKQGYIINAVKWFSICRVCARRKTVWCQTKHDAVKKDN